MSELRPMTETQSEALNAARRILKVALGLLKNADCPASADAVRRAIKSADGARRHADRRRRAAKDAELAGAMRASLEGGANG